ncbi:HIT family hydrolase [Cohnella kolymensis]|uniref:HIT family hydrolase n=1 Tax=Cohnella kolymensis TaxID=1590652 RepID=A0ABR5A0P7_9BACL|nr:histidine triad nucleotide-binding protein [Cohnella kolymensis]KIL34606.1 HIT family hydrolase [Cohnella kolymensis]
MDDCIFCKIIQGAIPSTQIYEDERVMAFHDIEPQAPVHMLVIPKKHIASMAEAEPDDAELMGHVLLTAQRIAREAGLEETGYRIINNCGKNAGQLVFHIHFHVLGGEKLGGLNSKG